MLDQAKRTTILTLHQDGMGIRAIARNLRISRNAVRRVLDKRDPEPPKLTREDRLEEYLEDIEALIEFCDGNLVRVHEELMKDLRKVAEAEDQTGCHPADEEAGAGEFIPVPYSTFTAFCRRHGLDAKTRKGQKRLVGQYHFDPGVEFQHDTSPCEVVIGGKRQTVQIAAIIECHSGWAYLQAFPRWQRFHTRCFLSEGLQRLGGVPRRCMVDNASVVVIRGTGRNAVMAPTMVSFGERFGFGFEAHEKGDANRSARVERLFDFLQRNGLAGRRFDSLEHFNEFLLEWGDEKQNNAPKRRLDGRTPFEVLEENRRFLRPLPPYIPEEYRVHERTVTVEGMVHVARNAYSVPAELVGRKVQVRESRRRIRICQGYRLLADHPAFPEGARRRSVLPQHRELPRSSTKRPKPAEEEARVLASADDGLGRLVGELRKAWSGRAGPRIRKLHKLYLDYPTEVLVDAVALALRHGLIDLERIERIVLRALSDCFFRLPSELDEVEDDEGEGHGIA